MLEVVDGEQADALGRDAACCAGEKVEQDLVRIIDRPVRRWKSQLPFEARHSQLARVLGLVVIDDCQGDATLEGREGQTCPLIGRIVAAIRDRPSGLAGKRAKHRVHFSNEAFDNATRSIVNNAALVKKIYLPRELFPVSSVIVSFVNFFPQLLLLLTVVLVIGWRPNWLQLAAIPLAMLILVAR